LVKARSRVTRRVTRANPQPFFLQSSTPHVDGLMRKTGTSVMHVMMHDIAESATGVEALFSSCFVRSVFVTATAM